MTLRNTDPNDRTIRAPWEAGKPVYRGSMAGSCPRELLLNRVGVVPTPVIVPTKTQNRGELGAREGSLHEAWIVQTLMEQGYELEATGEGDAQSSLRKRFKRYIIRSHPDGRIRGLELGEEWHVLECKALNQDGYARWQRYGWEGFFKYACQVSLEMWLSNSPAYFVVKNRNTGEMETLIVKEPPVEPQELVRKFSLVEDLAELIEEEGEITNTNMPECGEGAEWYFCPFFDDGHCEVRTHVEKNNLVVEDGEFEEILSRYRVVKETMKSFEGELADLRMLIIERMAEPKIRVGGYFTSYSQKVRRNFDGKRAEARLKELGEDTKQYWYENPYQELRVTQPKGKTVDQESDYE